MQKEEKEKQRADLCNIGVIREKKAGKKVPCPCHESPLSKLSSGPFLR